MGVQESKTHVYYVPHYVPDTLLLASHMLRYLISNDFTDKMRLREFRVLLPRV